MTFDHRIAAYIGAIDRIESASELKAKHYKNVAKYHKYDYPVNLPDDYWALIAEADVLAKLANVDSQVGYQAGAYMEDKQQIKEKRREQFSADLFKSEEDGREDA